MSSEDQKRTIEQKKEKVLESAIKRFSKKGYDATTISEIAKDANVSFGLVSTYYGNKEELFTVCVTKPAETYLEEMLKFNTQPAIFKTEISQMIKNHIKIIYNRKDYLRLLVQVNSQYERFPKAFQVANLYTQKLTKKIELLIRNGQMADQLASGNTEKIAIAYVSLLFGLRLSYADDPTSEDWNQFAEIALRLFGPK
jgi:TetR/AcrR family transcriptional regulator, mexJK operon transcriptional repressor